MGSGINFGLRQPLQIGRGFKYYIRVVFILENALTEFSEQTGQSLIDCRQTLFGNTVQLCAGTREILVLHPGQSLLFRCQTALLTLSIDSGDAFKQHGILRNGIMKCGQSGLHFTFYCLNGLVAHAARIYVIDG